jgi:NAD(P)-dependent dehydrogenase (short-subunit alcohol dehydrogenase family)
MKLKDKVSIITGSAQNVGKEIALLFAKEGSKIVVTDINDEKGIFVKDDIIKNGREAIYVSCDTTKPQSVKFLISETMKYFGAVDILVNNVGNGYLSKITDQTEEEWYKTIDLTLNSAFLCSKYALNEMMQNSNGGIIINISSIDGLIGEYGYPSYNAGKAGMINLTRNIALDYSIYKVRANAICPGPIEADPSGQSAQKTSLFKDPEKIDKMVLDAIPMGRKAKTIDVAKAALFLASEDSGYINGTTLVVDGGLLAYSGLPKFTQLLK